MPVEIVDSPTSYSHQYKNKLHSNIHLKNAKSVLGVKIGVSGRLRSARAVC